MLSCWGHIRRQYTCLLLLSFILLSFVICFASQLGTVSNLLEADLISPTAMLSSILFKPRVQQRFGKRPAVSGALLLYLPINSQRMNAAKMKVPIFSVEAVESQPGGGYQS